MSRGLAIVRAAAAPVKLAARGIGAVLKGKTDIRCTHNSAAISMG